VSRMWGAGPGRFWA